MKSERPHAPAFFTLPHPTLGCMAPFVKHDPVTGLNTYWCAQCKCYYAASRFTPSSILRHVSRCRACRAKAVARRRRASPAAAAAHCLQEHVRHQGRRPATPITTTIVARILARAEGRSALSGLVVDDPMRLRIRPFWPDLPVSEWNAVVVTANENKSLGRRIGHDPVSHFPEEVIQVSRCPGCKPTLVVLRAPYVPGLQRMLISRSRP